MQNHRTHVSHRTHIVIKLTFECFFIHWTGEVFNIFHERTLIWWYDLRYSCFTNTILIICVLINFTKWLFVFNFVRTKMKSFPNGRFIRLIQELHCLSFWTRFTQVLLLLFSVTTLQFYLLQKKIKNFAISSYSLHSIHRWTYFSIRIHIFLCLCEKTFLCLMPAVFVSLYTFIVSC